jgi:hypothetical protein
MTRRQVPAMQAAHILGLKFNKIIFKRLVYASPKTLRLHYKERSDDDPKVNHRYL